MSMSGEDHRRTLDITARALASRIGGSDPDAAVPDCPGWTVRDLVLHTGGLYRWSARLVAERITVETWRSQMNFSYPDELATAAELAAWTTEVIAPMIDAFSVDEWTPVWTWGQSQRARFWPRRMLFETVVHGLDLDRAMAGSAPVDLTLDDPVAIDCLDEMLELVASRGRWAREPDPRPAVTGTVVLAPDDVGVTWRIRCRSTGMWWDRGADRADATLRGPIGELIALVHQRGRLDRPVGSQAVEVDGDLGLAIDWLDRLTF